MIHSVVLRIKINLILVRSGYSFVALSGSESLEI